MIDGSKSSDDGDDLSFTWVVSSGPMGYQPELPAVPTLTLDHLIAGKYLNNLQYPETNCSSYPYSRPSD